MNIFFKSFAKVFGFLTAVGIFLLAIGIITSFFEKEYKSNFEIYKNYSGKSNSDKVLAIIHLNGPILSEPTNLIDYNIFNSSRAIYPSLIESYLNELQENKLSGLIISINSPGGSVTGSQKIYRLFEEFKKRNNINIYFHTSGILASGAYWIAMSGDKIFAEYGAIIGSIGVKGPDWLFYNSPTSLSSGILGNYVESPNGIKLFSNTAGIYKDIFNPFREPSKNEINALQIMINDIYNDFVNLVSSQRKIEVDTIKNQIGAMIFNTKKAKENFLIDGQKEIDEIIISISEELKLDQKKILINAKKNSLGIFNLNMMKNLFSYDLHEKNIAIIQNKFCNNLHNEFSAVSISNYKTNC